MIPGGSVFPRAEAGRSAYPGGTKIAELTMHPPGAKELVLQTYPEVELLPYINEGCQVSATATGSQPPDDVTFDGLVTVRAKI